MVNCTDCLVEGMLLRWRILVRTTHNIGSQIFGMLYHHLNKLLKIHKPSVELMVIFTENKFNKINNQSLIKLIISHNLLITFIQ